MILLCEKSWAKGAFYHSPISPSSPVFHKYTQSWASEVVMVKHSLRCKKPYKLLGIQLQVHHSSEDLTKPGLSAHPNIQ